MLKNKTILIMGAGGLLGTQLTLESLNQHARVIAADANIELMLKRLKESNVNNAENIDFRNVDITNESSVIDLFENIGHIDGAVNATYPRNKKYGAHFFDVTMASFNENLSMHLGSSFLFTQQCAAYFQRNKNPLSIVNISSVYGVIAPKFDIYTNTKMTMPVEYAAIKSALLHLNKYIVKYVNDSRFRVNAVSPGGIFDFQPAEFLEAYKKNTNGVGMLGVEDVIGSIIFLLSNQSRYVTAQNIIVDDGFHL